MTIQQLRYVLRIVEKSSISEAADSLFVSQPSLSNAVKELEQELDIKIFLRNNKGTILSQDGKEFVQYAKQVVTQMELLEERYSSINTKKKFSISSQHYPFVVESFIELLKKYDTREYDFTLKETRTKEIIDDVKNFNSEIGILYLSSYNEKVMEKLFKENDLVYHELFSLKPQIFLSKKNPLCQKKLLRLSDLEDYPFLSFDQGDNSSFYMSEEIFNDIKHKKEIKVSDRATMVNMIIGLDGYTIGSGLFKKTLNSEDLTSIPLDEDLIMNVGYITKKIPLSTVGEELICIIKNYS